jgi:hypothetical protein
MSLKKEGFFPSILWPTNCKIQEKIKIKTERYSKKVLLDKFTELNSPQNLCFSKKYWIKYISRIINIEKNVRSYK